MASTAAVLQILVTANSTQANATLTKTQAQLRGVEATATRSTAALSTFGKVGAIGVGLAGAATVKMAADFDKSMRNVNSIAQLSEKRFARLEKQVLALAGPTAQAPKTLAEGLYDLVSSGFKANQAVKVLGASARAATAGLTDTATSTKAVAAVLNAYQLPASKAKKVSDELFSTVNYGVVSFEELAQTIGDTLPFASQIGVSLKEVGAATATMTKQGLSSAETMTRIRNVIQSLIKPNEDLKKTFDELNMTGEQMVSEYGLQGALEKLVGTTDGTKEAVAALFPNIRALGGVLSLTGANARTAEEDLRNMQNSSGATAKALSEQSKSISYQWQKFKAQMSAVAIEVGLKLLPALNDLLRWVNNLNLDPAIRALKEFWQSAGLLRDVISRVASAIKTNLSGLFEFIRSAVKLISGVLTGNFGRAWDGVKGIFSAGVKGIVSTVSLVTAPFRAVVAAIGRALKQPLDAAWSVVKKIFAKGADFILGVVTTIVDAMAKMADAGSKLPGPFGDAFDDIQTGLENTSDSINRSREDIRKWAESATASAKDLRKGVSTNVDGMATSVVMGFLRIGQATNKTLEAFGVKKLTFSLASSVAQGAQKHQRGGIIHAQSGTLVPGHGNGDKVPAMLEPGEVVINKKAVAAMGGARKANAINAMIPRFATGGVIEQALGPYTIPPVQYDPNHAGSNSHLHLDFFTKSQAIAYGKKMQGMGWTIGEYSGPYGGFGPITTQHQSPGHYDGTAFDANTAADETRSQVAAVVKLLNTGVAGGAVGAMVEKVKQQILKGPDGPLKDMGQAALDKVRSAANSYLSKQAPKGQTTGADMGPGAPIKSLPQNLAKWNKQYPYDSTQTMPASAVQALAAWQHLPSWFWRIAIGESAFQPGAVGHDPGGTTGYGLYQETDPFANAYVKAVTGGLDYTKMLNPVLNTMAAKLHYDAAPSHTPNTPGFPWYGTSGLQVGGIVQKLARGGAAKNGIKGTGPNGQHWSLHGTHGSTTEAAPSPGEYTAAMGLPDNIRKHLKSLRTARATLDEQINVREILDAFSTSELGADLGPTEKAGQIALNDQLLANLMEQVKWIKKGIKTPHIKPAVRTRLQKDLDTLQGITGTGGDILTVRQKLDTLAGTDTSTTADNSEMVSLLQQALQEANLRTAVSQAQYGVFGGMPVTASQGTVVQSNPSVNVNVGSGMEWLKQFIQVEVNNNTRSQARATGAPGSRMAGV